MSVRLGCVEENVIAAHQGMTECAASIKAVDARMERLEALVSQVDRRTHMRRHVKSKPAAVCCSRGGRLLTDCVALTAPHAGGWVWTWSGRADGGSGGASVGSPAAFTVSQSSGLCLRTDNAERTCH